MTANESSLIVVADDDPDVCAFLAQSIAVWGYRVTTVPTAEALRALLTEQLPGLILLDLEFGDVNSRSLLAGPDRIAPGIPVIVVSGNGSPATKAELLELGAIDFLSKPPPRGRLRELLAHIVRGSPPPL